MNPFVIGTMVIDSFFVQNRLIKKISMKAGFSRSFLTCRGHLEGDVIVSFLEDVTHLKIELRLLTIFITGDIICGSK
jgi:hypothetical protein